MKNDIKSETKEKNVIIHDECYIKKICFPEIHSINIENIKVTTEGRYSASHKKASDKLVYLIKKYFKTDELVITDATGNIGSDTIALGLDFKFINTIELDPTNYSALKNNVELYGLQNVKLFQGNSLEILPKLTQDVIYIDAPWGGVDYKKNMSLRLYLGNLELSDIYNKFKSKTKLFVFKIPYNYDFTYFIQNTFLDKYYIHSFRQKDKVKFYFLFAPTN